MANFVKTKVTASVISLAVLAMIPLLYNNFNAPSAFTRWGKPITWDNFAGVTRHFSQYDAAISSDVYLEYDSAAGKYYAFAAQNHNASWAKPFVRDTTDVYELNHEQYHFNITEIHARKMNTFILANPGKDELGYKYKLSAIQQALDSMQGEYDLETKHSINRDLQRWWEYRIDSLLLVHAGDSGLVVDNETGTQVFFPFKPQHASGTNSSGIPYRFSVLFDYDMTLLVGVFHQEGYTNDLSLLQFKARETYYNGNMSIQKMSVELDSNNDYYLRVIAEDSASEKVFHDAWRIRSSYLYRASAEMPKLSRDTVGYHRIAESFLKSFRIVEKNK